MTGVEVSALERRAKELVLELQRSLEEKLRTTLHRIGEEAGRILNEYESKVNEVLSKLRRLD